MRRHAVLMAMCLAVSGALAQPKDALAEATRQIAEGEFDQALKTLDAAIAKAKDAGQLAKLQLTRGQCLLALGKTDAARQAFAAALLKDPAIEIDPKHASPDAVDLFESARAATPGTVVVKVVSGEASVRIDGRAMGPAPLSTQLAAGTHKLEAKAADGRTASAEVKVVAGRKLEVALELKTDAPELKSAPVPEPRVERAPPPVEVPRVVEAPVSRPWVALIPAGAGAAAVAVGAVLWVGSNGRADALARHDVAIVGADPQGFAQAARVERVSGISLVAAGSVAVVGGTLWLLLGGNADVQPVVAAGGGGFSAGVAGRLP